jgi:Mce-associated membrane protein
VPPHRRSSAPRRPRVAGRHHPDPADRPGDVPPSGNGSDERTPRRSAQPGRSRRAWLTTPVEWGAVLVIAILVLVLAVGLAALFRTRATELSASPAAGNTALVDAGTTAEVTGQVRDAVEQVYSYDYARLDENERAAREVITGPFAEGFDEQFARVRELAPEQQAVVVATVPALAVKVLDGDRAIVVVFIDQQASRRIESQPLLAAGRLTVTAHRVDGRWKIADVVPF